MNPIKTSHPENPGEEFLTISDNSLGEEIRKPVGIIDQLGGLHSPVLQNLS